MIIKGLKSTKDKPQEIDLEDKIKTNVVFCTTVDPVTTEKGKFYSDIFIHEPTTSSRGNKYICVVYVHDCNAILKT